MILWGQVPNLAQRPLTMHAEQRNKGAKLAPTGLQLTPFLQVFVLHASAFILSLCLHITVLNAETALIHTPEGQT